VLARMAEEGYISGEQQLLAAAEPVATVEGGDGAAPSRYPAAHFVEEVKRWLLTESDALGDSQAERYNNLLRGGLTITTTIDLQAQATAEAAVAEILPDQVANPRTPDAALTSIDPATGHILAMVGGKDFWGGHPYAKLNLAEGLGRSTGSAFKPIVAATALQNGVPASKVYNAPASATFQTDSGPWRVKGGGIGAGTIADCTVVSSNTCYANIVLDPAVGAEASVETARRMGITSTELDAVPSAVLGANNATVRDMASVYATFANGGIHVPPVYVTKVERSDGTVLYEHRHEQSKAIEPEVARQINDILPGVIYAPNGTGTRAAIDRPAGGKTGSAQQNTDAWFCGYVTQMASCVWVGFSQTRAGSDGRQTLVSMTPGNTPITVFGGTYPAQIWSTFMGRALEGVPPLPLNPPLPPPTTTTTEPGRPAILDPVPPAAGGRVTVPDVTGQLGGSAESALQRAGLRVRTVEVDLGPTVAPGRTAAQSPPGGTSVAAGSTVWIEVTEGTPASRLPIPDLRGFGRGQATAELRALGFTVSETREAPPPGTLGPTGVPYVGGQVWKTTPATGEISPDGSVVIHFAPLEPTTTTTAPTSAPATGPPG
jgi:penicillin-binding protein 1A